MGISYFSDAQILAFFHESSWQSVVFREMAAALTSTTRPFPCIFGVAGYKSDELRFAFPEPMDARQIAPILRSYLGDARKIGRNTSLITFSRPESVTCIATYRDRLWQLLRELALCDSEPWPCNVPHAVDNPAWEFCFAGEPIFVVCNTPAHILRQSRRSSTFTLAFQPRWVSDNILSSASEANKAFTKVRNRLKTYDMIPLSPALGRYGDPSVREFQQYFLSDDNDHAVCPFATLRTK